MADEFLKAAIEEAERGLQEGGIPTVIVGENQTFVGEEELLRSRGVSVTVLQEPTCIDLMTRFITAHPDLWNEDIGV